MSTEVSRLIDEVRQQNRMMAQMLSRPVTGGAPSAASPPVSNSVWGQFSSSLVNASTSAAGALGRLASGTTGTADVLELATGVVGKFGTVGQAVGAQLQQLGSGIIEFNNVVRRTGDVGVTFSGNLGEMNKQVKQAQLTMPEFEDAIRRNAGAVAGLSSTMDKSASVYLKLTQGVQESQVGDMLKQAGMSSKELADITLLSIQNKRSLDLTEKASREQAIFSAAALAQEMDLVARITGKSREEQQRALKTSLDKAEVEASLLLLGDDARDQYAQLKVQMGPLGKNISELVDEIATGGVRTAEGTKRIAALGPAGAELEAAVRLQMSARTAEQKAQAEDAMERAKRKVYEFQQQDTNLKTVAAVGGEEGRVRREIFNETRDGQKQEAQARKEFLKEFGREGTAAEVAQMIRDKAALAQAGKEIDPKTGQVIENQGAIVSRTINQLDNLGKVAAGGVSEGLVKLNLKVGGTIGGLEDFNAFLRRYRTAQAAAGLPRDVVTAGTRVLGLPPPANPANLPPDRRNPTGSTAEPIREFGSPGVSSFLNGSGAFTGMFENWGKETLVRLHGEEAVIRKDQGINLVEKLLTDQAGGLQTQLTSLVKNKQLDIVNTGGGNLPIDVVQTLNRIKDSTSDMPKMLEGVVNQLKIAPSNDGKSGMPDMLSGMFGQMSGSINKMSNNISASVNEKPASSSISGNFDANINDGGLAHRAGEREFAQKFAAEGNLRSIDKLNADFDRALNKTGGSTASASNVSMPKIPGMDFFGGGFGGITSKITEVMSNISKPESKPPPAPKSPPPPPPAPRPAPPASVRPEVTLNDILNALNELNKTMSMAASNTESLNELSRRQIEVTRGLSGNRLT